jgi:hypothetical protein
MANFSDTIDKPFYLYTGCSLNNNPDLYLGGNTGEKFYWLIPGTNSDKQPIYYKYTRLLINSLDNLGFSYENEYSYPIKEILDKGKGNTAKLLTDVLSQAKSISQTLSKNGLNNGNSSVEKNESSLTSVFSEAPAYKTTGVLQLPNNFEFKFYYGLYGLYNGLYEVVVPSLKLASAFLPNETSNHTLQNLPLELSGSVLAGFISTLASSNYDDTSPNSNSSGDSESADAASVQNDVGSSILTGRIQGLMDRINNSLTGEANGAYSKRKLLCRGELGNLKTPVFTFTEVSLKYDFKNLDENGYPMAATVSLSGIQTPHMAVKNVIR